MLFISEPIKQAVEVLFFQKLKSNVHPPLFFNASEVSKADDHKHFGLIFYTKMLLVKHIN